MRIIQPATISPAKQTDKKPVPVQEPPKTVTPAAVASPKPTTPTRPPRPTLELRPESPKSIEIKSTSADVTPAKKEQRNFEINTPPGPSPAVVNNKPPAINAVKPSVPSSSTPPIAVTSKPQLGAIKQGETRSLRTASENRDDSVSFATLIQRIEEAVSPNGTLSCFTDFVNATASKNEPQTAYAAVATLSENLKQCVSTNLVPKKAVLSKSDLGQQELESFAKALLIFFKEAVVLTEETLDKINPSICNPSMRHSPSHLTDVMDPVPMQTCEDFERPVIIQRHQAAAMLAGIIGKNPRRPSVSGVPTSELLDNSNA